MASDRVPENLIEAIVQVHKVTPNTLFVYVPSKTPGVVAIKGIAHKSVKKYAHQIVDPPPGAYVPAGKIDTDTYSGPEDVMPLDPGGSVKIVQPGEEKQAKGGGIKKIVKADIKTPTLDQMVPVVDWTGKHIWVFMKMASGAPILIKLTHGAVKQNAYRIVAPAGAWAVKGKIDPYIYESPSDIYPLDWIPGQQKALITATAPSEKASFEKGKPTWGGKTADVVTAPNNWKFTGLMGTYAGVSYPEVEAPDGSTGYVHPKYGVVGTVSSDDDKYGLSWIKLKLVSKPGGSPEEKASWIVAPDGDPIPFEAPEAPIYKVPEPVPSATPAAPPPNGIPYSALVGTKLTLDLGTLKIGTPVDLSFTSGVTGASNYVAAEIINVADVPMSPDNDVAISVRLTRNDGATTTVTLFAVAIGGKNIDKSTPITQWYFDAVISDAGEIYSELPPKGKNVPSTIAKSAPASAVPAAPATDVYAPDFASKDLGTKEQFAAGLAKAMGPQYPEFKQGVYVSGLKMLTGHYKGHSGVGAVYVSTYEAANKFKGNLKGGWYIVQDALTLDGASGMSDPGILAYFPFVPADGEFVAAPAATMTAASVPETPTVSFAMCWYVPPVLKTVVPTRVFQRKSTVFSFESASAQYEYAHDPIAESVGWYWKSKSGGQWQLILPNGEVAPAYYNGTVPIKLNAPNAMVAAVGGWYNAFAGGTKLLISKEGKVIKAAEVQDEPQTPPPAPTPAPVPVKSVKVDLPVTKAGTVPAIGTLTKVGSGASLGGAGVKDIYKDANGNQYLWKPALDKSGAKIEPFRAYVQQAYSLFATRVRPEHIALSVDTVDGKIGTVQRMVSLATKKDLTGMKPSDLTDEEKKDLATDHMIDWVMSQHDSHGGNVVRTQDGRLVSIDKEQGFKYFPADKLSVDYHPNAQYGEKEPFANTFWRDFAAGKVDFDPKTLAAAVGKVEQIQASEYMDMLRPYADARFVSARDKHLFLDRALHRKIRLRQDMEKFITDLYKQRTGKDGYFTFADGWLTLDEKFKEIEIPLESAISSYGIKTASYLPTKEVTQAVLPKGPDSTITVLKVPLSEQADKLLGFLKQHRLDQIGEIEKGSAYYLAFVTTKSFKESKIKQVVEVSSTTSGKIAPENYVIDLPETDLAKNNIDDYSKLNALPAAKSVVGVGVRTDGGNVDGTNGRAVRWIDKSGEYYWLVNFKLRAELLAAVSGTASKTFSYPIGDWNPAKEAFDESLVGLSSVHSNSSKCVEFKVGKDSLYVVTESSKWSYYGSAYFTIYSDKENPESAMRKLLDKIGPGTADKVLRNPTEEEKTYRKARQMLWNVSPAEDRKFSQKDSKSPVPLKDVLSTLAKLGVGADVLDQIEEEDIGDGFVTNVLPGRYRTIAGGKLKLVWQGCGGALTVLSILKTRGLMGIHERSLRGIPLFAAAGAGTPESDIRSGSADQTLCRAWCGSGTPSFSGHTASGTYQAIIHPKVCDRLDWFMHGSDCFGACAPTDHRWTSRPSQEEGLKSLSSYYSSGNEVCFRRSIPLKYILRIVTANSGNRDALLAEMQKAKITEVNGMAADAFVAVESSIPKAYERFVKPFIG